MAQIDLADPTAPNWTQVVANITGVQSAAITGVITSAVSRLLPAREALLPFSSWLTLNTHVRRALLCPRSSMRTPTSLT
jgi:hypothetical protein